MKVHLVDATYELFRAWFAMPPMQAPDGGEVAATYGLMRQMMILLKDGATHVGCATDHVIKSFRNELYPGYKTDEGVSPKLLAQFAIAEEAMRALGLVVWPMEDLEADDGLASAALKYKTDPRVEQVLICTVDKDLTQVVDGTRVVMLKRKEKQIVDEAAVRSRYGIPPAAIPDWLGLVGDSADGFPGLPGWGEKSASALLGAYGSIEKIPDDWATWTVKPRGADKLGATLKAKRADAALYKKLATLRTDGAIAESVDDLEWRGARPELRDLCTKLGFKELPSKIERWREA